MVVPSGVDCVDRLTVQFERTGKHTGRPWAKRSGAVNPAMKAASAWSQNDKGVPSINNQARNIG